MRITSPQTFQRLETISQMFDVEPTLDHYRSLAEDLKSRFKELKVETPNELSLRIGGKSITGITGDFEIKRNGTRLQLDHWVTVNGKVVKNDPTIYIRAGQHHKRTAELYRYFERVAEFGY